MPFPHALPFCGCPSCQMEDFPMKISHHCLFRQYGFHVRLLIFGGPGCATRVVRLTLDSYNMGVAAHLSPLPKPGGVRQSRKAQSVLGFSMGTGKPVVFPKRVLWVRIWYWILAHQSTPCIRTTVLWVFMGIFLSTDEFHINFLLVFISVISSCHTVTQPNKSNHTAAQVFLIFIFTIPTSR